MDLIVSLLLNIDSGNAGLCRQITSPSTMRDIQWASQNCSLSFQTVGVWPENADGTDINAVSRSSDNTLVATGDDFGKVKLYTYPASQPRVATDLLLVIA